MGGRQLEGGGGREGWVGGIRDRGGGSRARGSLRGSQVGRSGPVQRPPGAARERAGAGVQRDRPELSPHPPHGRRLSGKPRALLGPAAAAAPAAPRFPGAAAAAVAGPGLRGGARRGKPQPRAGSGSGPAPPAAAPRGRGPRAAVAAGAGAVRLPRDGVRRPRHPRLRAASATRSAPRPGPQPGRGGRPGLPRFPVPRLRSRPLTLAGAAVAVLAVGQVVQHGAGCPRPHAAARELRAPRSAASRVPAPPPAAAGGRGLQCGGARALGSLLPAEPSPVALTSSRMQEALPPPLWGGEQRQGRGEAGEGAERSTRRLPAEPGGGRN